MLDNIRFNTCEPVKFTGVVMGLRVILARSLSEGSIPFTSTINEAIRRLTKELPAEILDPSDQPSSIPVGRDTLTIES